MTEKYALNIKILIVIIVGLVCHWDILYSILWWTLLEAGPLRSRYSVHCLFCFCLCNDTAVCYQIHASHLNQVELQEWYEKLQGKLLFVKIQKKIFLADVTRTRNLLEVFHCFYQIPSICNSGKTHNNFLIIHVLSFQSTLNCLHYDIP